MSEKPVHIPPPTPTQKTIVQFLCDNPNIKARKQLADGLGKKTNAIGKFMQEIGYSLGCAPGDYVTMRKRAVDAGWVEKPKPKKS